MVRNKSTFLFAMPSMVSGAARMFDFYGLYDRYNQSRNGDEADARAMFNDWSAVGDEINSAVKSLKDAEKVPA